MFEQTTPQSDCCSESVQALYLGGGHHLSGKIKQTYARTAKNDRFCLFVKLWTDRSLVQCLSFRAILELLFDWIGSWTLNSFQVCLKLDWSSNHRINSVPVSKLAAPPWTFLALGSGYERSGYERAHRPLCQTGAVAPREATEAIPSSNVTRVWSRHRNPLALKKLPPSLCLTSNGAFFSSLSFFMFVCKVLYITWIYYAHILPNG